MFRNIILTLATVAFSYPVIAESNEFNKKYEIGNYIEQFSEGYINTDLEYSRLIFDRQDNVTNKALRLLQFRQNGNINNKSFNIGGRFIGNYMYEHTNTDGKFPIISRLPNQHTQKDTGYESVISDASFNVTIAPASWLTAFGQWEYTEVEYPGQKTFQARKHWVTIGDLSKFPLYLTYGRKTVNFGNFSSYAPFTHSYNSHYFWAQSNDPHFELGGYYNGWHAAFSYIPNGRGNRVINTTDDEWGNFAININKMTNFDNDLELEFGASFLRGTIYDSTLAHHPPSTGAGDNQINSAWSTNARISYNNWDFMAEYTSTLDDWPATDWPVSALTLQTRYIDELINRKITYSLMFSRGVQGDENTEWERMEQTVAGIEYNILPNFDIGVEYLYNKGFVPLIMPTFTGDRDVESHTVSTGIKFTF